MSKKKEYRKEKRKRKRFFLYAGRAVLWLVMGLFLEISTSIFADRIFDFIKIKGDLFALFVILGVAIIAFLINYIRAKNAHPIYSMDNDFSVGLFAFFAVSGAFIDNFGAGWITNPLLKLDDWKQYIVASVLLFVAIVLIILDVTCIDKLYEKINRFPKVDFQYKVKDEKSTSYVKAVLRVNAAWIVVPMLLWLLCVAWTTLAILR